MAAPTLLDSKSQRALYPKWLGTGEAAKYFGETSTGSATSGNAVYQDLAGHRI